MRACGELTLLVSLKELETRTDEDCSVRVREKQWMQEAHTSTHTESKTGKTLIFLRHGRERFEGTVEIRERRVKK